MLWLFVAVGAYFLLAVVSLLDKYLLSGALSNPKVYAFYVGILGSFAFLLVPFGFFVVPDTIFTLAAAVFAGACQICGIYFYFESLKRFEPSRVIPAVGGLQPLFSFALIWFFGGGHEALDLRQVFAFFLMVLGSVAIVFEKKTLNSKSLKLAAMAAFLFALALVLSKFVYLAVSFIPGFILISVGSVATALLFLASKEVRQEAFQAGNFSQKRGTTAVFLANQAGGAASFLLQAFAVSLAPLAFVSVINAVAGIQYAFVFIFSVILSLYFPSFLREKVTKAVVLQKTAAILLIAAGLAIFAIN